MLGFIVGTACLFGVIKLIRARRHGSGCGYASRDAWSGGCGSGVGGWRHRHDHGRWGRGFEGHGFEGRGYGGGRDRWDRGDDDTGPGGAMLLRGLFERLQTTPGQERVIAESLKEIRVAFKKAADEKAKGAKQVAEAMRGDDFKTENMAEAFAHLDSSVDAVRDASFSALAKIHEALDERQRKILADLIGRGGRALEHLAEQA